MKLTVNYPKLYNFLYSLGGFEQNMSLSLCVRFYLYVYIDHNMI